MDKRDLLGLLCGFIGLITALCFGYTTLILNDPSFSLGTATAMLGSAMIILKSY